MISESSSLPVRCNACTMSRTARSTDCSDRNMRFRIASVAAARSGVHRWAWMYGGLSETSASAYDGGRKGARFVNDPRSRGSAVLGRWGGMGAKYRNSGPVVSSMKRTAASVSTVVE